MENKSFEKCLGNAAKHFVEKNALMFDARNEDLARSVRTLVMDEFRKMLQSEVLKCEY
jgi:hypothetical protein